MALVPAKQPYKRRIPTQNYSDGWLGDELGNIQRAMFFPFIVTVLSDYTPTSADFTVLVNASAGPVTITLRPVNQAQFLYLNIKKIDNSANAVTIAGTVDGVVNPTLATQYKSMTIHSDGLAYYKLGAV